MNLHRNHEGYRDPTAGAAFGRIIREERRKRRQLAQEQADQEAQTVQPSTHRQRYVNIGKHRRCGG